MVQSILLLSENQLHYICVMCIEIDKYVKETFSRAENLTLAHYLRQTDLDYNQTSFAWNIYIVSKQHTSSNNINLYSEYYVTFYSWM
jgi:hypothetical protein